MKLEHIGSVASEFGVPKKMLHECILSYSNRFCRVYLHLIDGGYVIDGNLVRRMRARREKYEGFVVPRDRVLERARPHLPIKIEPCVYFLVSGKSIVYVGQTVGPLSRMHYHIKDGVKEFDSVYLSWVDKRSLEIYEYVNIEHHNPIYNKARLSQENYLEWLINGR